MKYLNYRLSAAMWSRVLLLWIVLGFVGLALGVAAVAMGNFVQSNIRSELASQQITFNAVEKMSDEEKALPGLVENAGQQLVTGNQAQIYASLIGLHVKEAAAGAGYPDATYATLGGIVNGLKADLKKATEAGDQTAIDAAQKKVTDASGLRTTMQAASGLRGNLLSAYGWDNVGTGISTGGAVVMVLSLVFFALFFFEWSRGHLPATEA